MLRDTALSTSGLTWLLHDYFHFTVDPESKHQTLGQSWKIGNRDPRNASASLWQWSNLHLCHLDDSLIQSDFHISQEHWAGRGVQSDVRVSGREERCPPVPTRTSYSVDVFRHALLCSTAVLNVIHWIICDEFCDKADRENRSCVCREELLGGGVYLCVTVWSVSNVTSLELLTTTTQPFVEQTGHVEVNVIQLNKCVAVVISDTLNHFFCCQLKSETPVLLGVF